MDVNGYVESFHALSMEAQCTMVHYFFELMDGVLDAYGEQGRASAVQELFTYILSTNETRGLILSSPELSSGLEAKCIEFYTESYELMGDAVIEMVFNLFPLLHDNLLLLRPGDELLNGFHSRGEA